MMLSKPFLLLAWHFEQWLEDQRHTKKSILNLGKWIVSNAKFFAEYLPNQTITQAFSKWWNPDNEQLQFDAAAIFA